MDVLLKPVGANFKGWQKIEPEQLEYYLSIILAAAKYVLVDEVIPVLITALHRRGISTMGFTACSTGRIGVIASMTEWRLNQLRALGIDFSSSFTEEYTFSELCPTLNPPLFKNGILFTGDFQYPERSSKGELLAAFLDRINWEPEQIIFIEDNRKHLEAVELVANQKRIPFQGYLIEQPAALLDEKIAEFQIRTLLESGIWISDKFVISSRF